MSFNFTRRLMEKNSNTNSFLTLLAKEEVIPEKVKQNLLHFYENYKNAVGLNKSSDEIFTRFLLLVKEQMEHPFSFEPYHEQIRAPFDYYAFGLDMLRPLVDIEKSSLRGEDNLKQITAYLSQGDNVVLLSNHQTEADPQAISILLEKNYNKLAAEMIFVAGERVITDPVAVPFSMGRNLICIYSKRYIDHPPEQKLKKQLHNKHTMELMSKLLIEGGKCIYVAPSGGRDRRNEQGVIEVAPFDPQSIEMFYLMAKKAKTKTHFFTLALKTYDLLPPPVTIQVELGETRHTQRAGIHLSFGKEINMQHFPGDDALDKHVRRENRSTFIWQQVKRGYTNNVVA